MDQISAAIRSEPSGGVTHARNAYFLTYRLADLGCSSIYRLLCRQNIRAVKGQWPKISVVNGQTAEKSLSKFWPVVAAVTRESMGVTPPWCMYYVGHEQWALLLVSFPLRFLHMEGKNMSGCLPVPFQFKCARRLICQSNTWRPYPTLTPDSSHWKVQFLVRDDINEYSSLHEVAMIVNPLHQNRISYVSLHMQKIV